jgi:hypothetical protein
MMEMTEVVAEVTAEVRAEVRAEVNPTTPIPKSIQGDRGHWLVKLAMLTNITNLIK